MIERFEVRFSGAGGQGVILAGIILGEAAAIYEGKRAVQTQSYGPEARGGASKSEVVISDVEIDYPKVTSPDIVVALTQEAADKHSIDLKEGGILIVDDFFVKRIPQIKGKLLHLPIVKTSVDTFGTPLFANIIALGVLCALIEGLVKKESFEKAILARVPQGTEDKNLRAFNIGYEIGRAAVD
ncbi:MAG: 2-oxoglutarate ferredoxin oxidoreductase subunit gamma [bacterium]|nr:2-oxoglutarate ferredoxin oxidoreductase subunit gamma [bacterium]